MSLNDYDDRYQTTLQIGEFVKYEDKEWEIVRISKDGAQMLLVCDENYDTDAQWVFFEDFDTENGEKI